MTLEEFLGLEYDFKKEIVKFKPEDDEIDRFAVYQAIGIAEENANDIRKNKNSPGYNESEEIYKEYYHCTYIEIDNYDFDRKIDSGEADRCALMQEIYEKLWDKEILSKCRYNSGDNKGKVCGDTMNSCNITLDALLGLYKSQLKNKYPELKEQLNKVKKSWSKRASTIVYKNAKSEFVRIIGSYKNAREFLKMAYTLGNFIPVPPCFNDRGTSKIKDYWDLTLLAIYNWFMEQTKKPIVYKITLIDVVKSDKIKKVYEWLECFKDWDDFVEKNYLQAFVYDYKCNGKKKYGVPKVLWEGHFSGDVLPTKEDDFSQFFTNASAWIAARGERIALAVKKKLEDDEFVKSIISKMEKKEGDQL